MDKIETQVISRTCFQITCIVILWGRCSEIHYEITFGEKKNVGSGYSASARLLESAARFESFSKIFI